MSLTGPERAASTPPPFVVKSYLDLSNLPEADGKFVLLSRGRGVHLVLSPVDRTPYHANIVYQYLQVEGRGTVEAASSSGCRILSGGWEVNGGGYYRLQGWLHLLSLHGKSTAFGKYRSRLLLPFMDEVCPNLGLEGFTLELD